MSRPEAPRTLGAVALAEFSSLAEALGLSGDAGEWLGAFEAIAAPCAWWGRSESAPRLPSGVSHGRPFGFSMVIGAGAPELRFFMEAQASSPDPEAYWRVGQSVTEEMVRLGASNDRLREIEDLFVPTDPRAPFRVWHGGVFSPARPPLYKIYLCTAAAGRSARMPRLEEALSRLGMGGALAPLQGKIDSGEGEVMILSLDLVAGSMARLKLYLLQREAGLEALASAYGIGAGAQAHAARDTALLVRTMLGERMASPMAWLTCHNSLGDVPEPVGSVVHLGLMRHLSDDRLIEARLGDFCDALGLDGAPYTRCRLALGEEASAHHFMSLQRSGGVPRVTVYFAPRRDRRSKG